MDIHKEMKIDIKMDNENKNKIEIDNDNGIKKILIVVKL